MLGTLGGGAATAESDFIVAFPHTHSSTCVQLSVRRLFFFFAASFLVFRDIERSFHLLTFFIGIFNKRHFGFTVFFFIFLYPREGRRK